MNEYIYLAPKATYSPSSSHSKTQPSHPYRTSYNCYNIVFISFSFSINSSPVLRIISFSGLKGDFEGLCFHTFSSLDTWEMMMGNAFTSCPIIISVHHKLLNRVNKQKKNNSDDFLKISSEQQPLASIHCIHLWNYISYHYQPNFPMLLLHISHTINCMSPRSSLCLFHLTC